MTGDGIASVAELIDSQINSDPRRGAEEEFPLDLIVIDERRQAARSNCSARA